MASATTESRPVRIEIPTCEKGIGKLILAPDSKDLIAGVHILPYPVFPDDRGYFLEIARIGHGLPAAFPRETTQISAALSYPGTIKAFHYHLHQTDCWVPLDGMLQIVLVDLRPDSATFGLRNTIYVGAHRRWQVLVPPGIGHGYKVIGTSPAMLVYLTDRFYNPQDEGRIAYDHPQIQYDWETQHK
jgi:dTDP-4-dehydrorhamnose 3,5-epimerase